MTGFTLNTTRKTLTIGGQDVSEHITAVDVYMPAGEPAEVQVWVNSPGVITGDGIITVHEPADAETLKDGIRSFLEAVDVKELQAAANTLPSTWSTTPAQLVVQALLGAL